MSYGQTIGSTPTSAADTGMGAMPAAGAVFAASTMLLVGMFQVFQGVAGLLQDSFFVVDSNYAYEIDVTAWAWTHLIVGSIVMVAGFCIFTGALWRDCSVSSSLSSALP